MPIRMYIGPGMLRLALVSLIALAGGAVWAVSNGSATEPRVIRVGEKREIHSIAAAAAVAKDGDVIEVDAGTYTRDVAVWKQNNLSLRAVGGRARLLAGGAAAEDKAIWVVRGGAISVEGFDFEGAKVRDRNGAGIRLEKGKLKVRDCRFTNNENGLLTGGDGVSTLDIENSEFGNNGAGDGLTHNLYVGAIARLSVTGSYFHHARVGHLLKSRALFNLIRYNRLTDEIGGQASYELEFPSGGQAYVIGNVIQQSSTTENPNIISFGAEGYSAPKSELYLVNNTLVDLRPKNGVFLKVAPGKAKVVAINNLLLGEGKLESAGPGDYQNNYNVDFDEFVRAIREDFRLVPTSKLIGKATLPGQVDIVELKPGAEYFHPRSSRPLSAPQALNPGAMQSVGP